MLRRFWAAWAERSRVAELSIGEFGEALRFVLRKKKGVRLVVFTRNMKKSFFFASETRRCVF